MALDFRSARHWAREMMEEALEDGARVIDATMGNGHDTLWLCRRVGDCGRVVAFDVQREALKRTEERLKEAGMIQRAELHCVGHEQMGQVVQAPVDGVLFNLGWLPGAEHGVTTRVETTLQAVGAALDLLKPGGLMTVCVYPGHEEGARERDALLQWASALDYNLWDVMLKSYLNQPNDPPLMLAIRKRHSAGRLPTSRT